MPGCDAPTENLEADPKAFTEGAIAEVRVADRKAVLITASAAEFPNRAAGRSG